MRFNAIAGASAAALLAAAPLPAHAQMVEARYDQVMSALEETGFATAMRGEGADRFIVSNNEEGYSFAVFFFGCDDQGEDCKTAQFYAGFEPETSPTLEQMNDYAGANRWGRIYLDAKGDPTIEMDVDLEDGGMPRILFMDNVEYWATVMNAFGDWVFENSEK